MLVCVPIQQQAMRDNAVIVVVAPSLAEQTTVKSTWLKVFI
jgi:hypothetical protein